MNTSLTTHERRLAFGVALLCALAALIPPIHQDPAYHQFADARTILGVPRALDSLSNVGFLLLGLYGMVLLASDRLTFFSAALKASVAAFFIGIVATAAGSTYYHLAPSDPGLVVDRLGMVITFAGMLGMATTHRISERSGWALLLLALAAGPASVLYWGHSGSLSPYAVVQFGGIGLALAMMLAPARGPGPKWWWLGVAYALAKICEGLDPQIFALTGQMVSGHTIKHVLAALPVLGVTVPLRRVRR